MRALVVATSSFLLVACAAADAAPFGTYFERETRDAFPVLLTKGSGEIAPEEYGSEASRQSPTRIHPEPVPTATINGPFKDGEFFGTRLAIQAEISPVVAYYLEFGFNALWTMTGPRLLRIDPSGYAVTSFWIPGATGEVRVLVAQEGALWIPDVGAQRIYKFDPQSRSVLLAIQANMSSRDGSIAIGQGSVWVITDNDRLLERFSVETGEQQATILLPSESMGIAVDAGSVWVTGYLAGELYRIDPTTNSVTGTTRLHPGPRFIISGFGSLWVFSEGDSTIQRVDPKTARVVASIPVGGSGLWADMAVGGGFVWFTKIGLPLAQIDPQTNRIALEFNAPFVGAPLRYGAGSLWYSPNWFIYRVAPPELSGAQPK